jgi:hypothetical protein
VPGGTKEVWERAQAWRAHHFDLLLRFLFSGNLNRIHSLMLTLDGPAGSLGRIQVNRNERRWGGGEWSGHDGIRLGRRRRIHICIRGLR